MKVINTHLVKHEQYKRKTEYLRQNHPFLSYFKALSELLCPQIAFYAFTGKKKPGKPTHQGIGNNNKSNYGKASQKTEAIYRKHGFDIWDNKMPAYFCYFCFHLFTFFQKPGVFKLMLIFSTNSSKYRHAEEADLVC